MDVYSPPDTPLREYDSVDAVRSAYGANAPVSRDDAPVVQLALWRDDFGPPPIVYRIHIVPGAVPGHTHRFAASGWGLIHLVFGSNTRRGRTPSSLSAFTQKSALQWADDDSRIRGPVDAWNWPVIAKVQRQLRAHITRHLATDTHLRRPVLRACAAQCADGLVLTPTT